MATSTLLGYDELPALLTILTGDEKHAPSAYSTLDVLWVLYDRVLQVDPSRVDDPGRDRFVLSKGHGCAGYYAVLAAKGFIPVETLAPGVEISSGSLGHGLPIAVGMTLALDARAQEGARVVCLIGDGELDEGSNFEAIQLAGRLALGRLTVVAVDNDSATFGWPGGIERRFALEGWSAVRADGRDHDALEHAFGAASGVQPHCVVAEIRV